jgi:TatD DNase family protein
MMIKPLAPSPTFVDAHCHLDLYDNPAEIIAQAEARSIYTIAVTNAPSVFFHTAQLTATCKYVRAAVGLHPELVHSHRREIDQMRPLLQQTRFVGEIGLDYQTADETRRKNQRDILSSILAWCAEDGNKILTLHSRRAAADVIAIVGNGFPGVAILHWFSGTRKELDKAIHAGFYFSVNPSMTASAKGRSLIDAMPPDRVLTETDGPFVKIDSRPAHPQDVSEVIKQLADIWHLSAELAAQQVLQNLSILLQDTRRP